MASVVLDKVNGDRAALRALYRAPEAEVLASLLKAATPTPDEARRIEARARNLVRAARAAYRPGADVSGYLREFGLGTAEGVALLCLAEALLRIPDAATADRLIEDRIARADWERHLGHADSLAMNASAFAFMLTGRVLGHEGADKAGVPATIGRMMRRLGEPVIRTALRRGMRVLARQFVLGRTIGEALGRASSGDGKRWRYSFDMLGEAAKTTADAERYQRAYTEAIGAIGKAAAGRGPIEGPGISVKLSALYPRYEPLQEKRAVPALIDSLGALARAAKAADIGLTMDAEEVERLEISLDVFEAVLRQPALDGWDGLGLAVQGYQKRALGVLDWVAAIAGAHRVPVRLVKGAYWDSEIKLTQLQGFSDYPVFTRKVATDVSWLAASRKMLREHAIRPAFATHNAQSLATILELAEPGTFEMQRLHGMGGPLYEGVVGKDCPVRVYAPVGTHEDLLAYLVRRLLENGANTSFVHRLVDPTVAEETIIADPVARLRASGLAPNPRIKAPSELYPDRKNSAGFDLTDRAIAPAFLTSVADAAKQDFSLPGSGPLREIRDPADRSRLIGATHDASPAEIDATLARLVAGFPAWNARGGAARAAILERAADAIEADRATLLYLLAREAGRTLADGLSEIREAADFLRYYALRARTDFAEPRELPGATGEKNTWQLEGRGVFVAISPWNFPLSIFTGQVAAALAAGNSVIAKPAEQTPLVAARAIARLHEAGVPDDALALVTGDGPGVGARLIADPRIAGVAFTGGTDTARAIAVALAERSGPIVPLIAETGGVNAMLVDSSALPEQVVTDAVASAFGSAGQRCSALRLLCLQEEIAPCVLTMLKGAAETLAIGDPLDPATDVGPVIDEAARDALGTYAKEMGKPLFALDLPKAADTGCFFAPRAYALKDAGELKREVFGPVLHVVRYEEAKLDQVLDAIAANGFGLTLGVQSRIESTQRRIVERLGVGNTYVNRNQIGAVVGVQPFGGRGLSGTGPKAGGPITLYRFAEERSVSINTAAVGGNAALFAADEG